MDERERQPPSGAQFGSMDGSIEEESNISKPLNSVNNKDKMGCIRLSPWPSHLSSILWVDFQEGLLLCLDLLFDPDTSLR